MVTGSPAGKPGAPLPQGADTIVIQEDTERRGDAVEVKEGAPKGRYIRRAGLDFAESEVLLRCRRSAASSTTRAFQYFKRARVDELFVWRSE